MGCIGKSSENASDPVTGGDEGDFDASDFSNIVSVATEKLEGGREWTRRTRSAQDSSRASRPRVPTASTVGENKAGGGQGGGD